MTQKNLKLHLRDLNKGVVTAWAKYFDGCSDVTISQGDIFDGTQADAIISPSQSFGFMDGGIDLAYSYEFGWKLSEALRDKIAWEHDGELLVGQAATLEIAPTMAPNLRPGLKFKYLISAPTMRVPMDVSQTLNAYLAFRAALREAYKHPEITTVLCPGLGTAIGLMDYEVCAKQMRTAWDEKGVAPRYPTLRLAHRRHYEMLPEEVADLE